MQDVIICGGSVAGSSLAYFLRNSGLKVMLFEKETFPRYKPCGGAFPVSMAEYFKFSLKDVIDKTITRTIIRRNNSEFVLDFRTPWVYLARRPELDRLLFRKARETGCEILDGTKVKRVEENVVFTDRGKFRGKIIVGAGGTSSPVRYSGKFPPRKHFLKTISADIPDKSFEEMIFDFSYSEDGYAWIFPKNNEISAGIGFSGGSFDKYGPIFEKFLADYSIKKPEKIYETAYPVFSRPINLFYKNKILIGDAGDLSDVSTGGGIINAVRSARYAADAIELYFMENQSLRFYQKQVVSKIYPMLIVSKISYNLFHKAPLAYTFLRLLQKHIIDLGT